SIQLHCHVHLLPTAEYLSSAWRSTAKQVKAGERRARAADRWRRFPRQRENPCSDGERAIVSAGRGREKDDLKIDGLPRGNGKRGRRQAGCTRSKTCTGKR